MEVDGGCELAEVTEVSEKQHRGRNVTRQHVMNSLDILNESGQGEVIANNGRLFQRIRV